MIAARLAILAALWSPMVVASCLRTQVIRVPVVIQPPPCLDTLPPDPPATEDDAAWRAYHARMEAWAAYAVGACGEHLTEPADDEPVGHYGG